MFRVFLVTLLFASFNTLPSASAQSLDNHSCEVLLNMVEDGELSTSGVLLTALEILDSSRSRRALRRKLRACKRNAKRRAQEEVIRRLMQAKRRERMREVEDKFDRYERWVEPREERPDWEEEGSSDHHEDDDWLLFEDDDLY